MLSFVLLILGAFCFNSMLYAQTFKPNIDGDLLGSEIKPHSQSDYAPKYVSNYVFCSSENGDWEWLSNDQGQGIEVIGIDHNLTIWGVTVIGFAVDSNTEAQLILYKKSCIDTFGKDFKYVQPAEKYSTNRRFWKLFRSTKTLFSGYASVITPGEINLMPDKIFVNGFYLK